MPYPLTQSPSTFLGLFTPQGAHVLGFGWLFGVNAYQSFLNGPVAFGALPRLQFRVLQSRIFPVYFLTNSVISSLLLLTQYTLHPPHSISSIFDPSSPAGFQTLVLGVHAACHVANWLGVGPWATRVMNKRAKLEREEGKAYNDEGVSVEMKRLNKLFMQTHGYSAGLNMIALIAIGLHGLYAARYGF